MSTNEELKKKIVDITQMKLQECALQPIGITYGEAAEYVADAITAEVVRNIVKIAREIGVSATAMAVFEAEEAKHRAEVAERALKNRAISHVSKCFPNEISGLENCVQEVYEAWIYQAKKELAEEKKNGAF